MRNHNRSNILACTQTHLAPPTLPTRELEMIRSEDLDDAHEVRLQNRSLQCTEMESITTGHGMVFTCRAEWSHWRMLDRRSCSCTEVWMWGIRNERGAEQSGWWSELRSGYRKKGRAELISRSFVKGNPKPFIQHIFIESFCVSYLF